jgi:hypothetical protein
LSTPIEEHDSENIWVYRFAAQRFRRVFFSTEFFIIFTTLHVSASPSPPGAS